MHSSVFASELVTAVRSGGYRCRDRLEQESVAVGTVTPEVIDIPDEAIRRSDRLGRWSASGA